jgi:hypothetical protein
MADCPPPTQVALVRRRYLAGDTVRSILSDTGMRRDTLRRCLNGEHADGSGITPTPIAKRPAGARHHTGSRAALVARMWRAAERQVEQIEHRLKAAGLELPERESNTRMLATMAKTLRELAAFDEAQKPRGKETPDADDNTVPRNVDDLRRELARKLELFVAGRAHRVPGNAE